MVPEVLIDESFEGKVYVQKDREARKLLETFRLQQVCEHTVDKAISMHVHVYSTNRKVLSRKLELR